MEIRQLEYLVAVAEEANFTRAAARVHISQSGISAQIRELEKDLGAMLIDRSGRSATLTNAGQAAVEHARAVLTSVRATRQAVDEVRGLTRGRLVIGMVTACTVAPLFDALAAFHLAHPGVDLALQEDNSDQLIEAVRAGSMDLALVGTAGGTPDDLAALQIISEGISALVPATTRWRADRASGSRSWSGTASSACHLAPASAPCSTGPAPRRGCGRPSRWPPARPKR